MRPANAAAAATEKIAARYGQRSNSSSAPTGCWRWPATAKISRCRRSWSSGGIAREFFQRLCQLGDTTVDQWAALPEPSATRDLGRFVAEGAADALSGWST